jgi:hypothetical protein
MKMSNAVRNGYISTMYAGYQISENSLHMSQLISWISTQEHASSCRPILKQSSRYINQRPWAPRTVVSDPHVSYIP